MMRQITAPTAMPMTPPTTPMPSVSAMIWRTTRPRDQPIARSDPISRTRFETLESVKRPAMRKRPTGPRGPGLHLGRWPVCERSRGSRHLIGEGRRREDRRTGERFLDGLGDGVHVVRVIDGTRTSLMRFEFVDSV